MSNFKKLNEISGFDMNDLNNARQNNYAWSMAELGDYIYVGTGRNIVASLVSALGPTANIPLISKGRTIDNTGEIWRYKKDGSMPWQRVFKALPEDNIMGFRFMINHAAPNSSPALYVASSGDKVCILKSTDGTNWTKLKTDNVEGTSSRAMASFNGKLYMATLFSGVGGDTPLLYASEDPEFFPFESIIDTKNPHYDASKNPASSFLLMSVFNNKLYLANTGDEGLEIWRSNTSTPKLNDWTLVLDKGIGDAANLYVVGMGQFKDHLYISASKSIPTALLIPMGADLARIDKNDNWELVVGGSPIIPSNPTTGTRNASLSKLTSGFSNPFNVYLWQIKEYNGNLIVTTFDDSINIEAIRNIALANKDIFIHLLGSTAYMLLLKIYDKILELLNRFNYQKGFNAYISRDGVNFNPLFLDGLGNPFNYGGRILFVDSENNLYLGTANPYSGCEVFKGSKVLAPSISIRSFLNNFPILYELQNQLDDLYIDFLKDVLSNSAISDLFKI